MTSFPSIPGGDYRLINATVPLCLLEAADGGNARSDALASATLTIRAGKIQRLALDTHAGVAPGPRPGPAILYAPPAVAPQLTNTGIWHAKPILVSGWLKSQT